MELTSRIWIYKAAMDKNQQGLNIVGKMLSPEFRYKKITKSKDGKKYF